MTSPSSLTVTGVGPRGPRGPGILAGRGLPSAQTGLNARAKDIYLDLDTGDVYGPYVKATNTWPAEPIMTLSLEPDEGQTSAQVTAAIDAALAGLSLVTTTQVNALIADALAELPPSGLTEQQVVTLIGQAISALPPDNAGLTVGQVNALIAAALDELDIPEQGVTSAEVATAISNALAALPPSGLSEEDVQALIDASIDGIDMSGAINAAIATALAPYALATDVADDIQAAIATAIAGLPADAITTSAQVQAIVDTALSDFEPGMDTAAIQALIDAAIDALPAGGGGTPATPHLSLMASLAPYPDTPAWRAVMNNPDDYDPDTFIAGYGGWGVHDGIFYIISGYDNRGSAGYLNGLLRWDLEAGEWLDPIPCPLPDGATECGGPVTPVLARTLDLTEHPYLGSATGSAFTHAQVYDIEWAGGSLQNPGATVLGYEGEYEYPFPTQVGFFDHQVLTADDLFNEAGDSRDSASSAYYDNTIWNGWAVSGAQNVDAGTISLVVFSNGPRPDLKPLALPSGASFVDSLPGQTYGSGGGYYGVINGKVYMGGGDSYIVGPETPEDVDLNDIGLYDDGYGRQLMEYDIATETWRTCAPCPVGVDWVMFGVADDKLYVVGTDNEKEDNRLCHVYDPSNDTWTLTDLLTAHPDNATFVMGSEGSWRSFLTEPVTTPTTWDNDTPADADYGAVADGQRIMMLGAVTVPEGGATYVFTIPNLRDVVGIQTVTDWQHGFQLYASNGAVAPGMKDNGWALEGFEWMGANFRAQLQLPEGKHYIMVGSWTWNAPADKDTWADDMLPVVQGDVQIGMIPEGGATDQMWSDWNIGTQVGRTLFWADFGLALDLDTWALSNVADAVEGMDNESSPVLDPDGHHIHYMFYGHRVFDTTTRTWSYDLPMGTEFPFDGWEQSGAAVAYADNDDNSVMRAAVQGGMHGETLIDVAYALDPASSIRLRNGSGQVIGRIFDDEGVLTYETLDGSGNVVDTFPLTEADAGAGAGIGAGGVTFDLTGWIAPDTDPNWAIGLTPSEKTVWWALFRLWQQVQWTKDLIPPLHTPAYFASGIGAVPRYVPGQGLSVGKAWLRRGDLKENAGAPTYVWTKKPLSHQGYHGSDYVYMSDVLLGGKNPDGSASDAIMYGGTNSFGAVTEDVQRHATKALPHPVIAPAVWCHGESILPQGWVDPYGTDRPIAGGWTNGIYWGLGENSDGTPRNDWNFLGITTDYVTYPMAPAPTARKWMACAGQYGTHWVHGLDRFIHVFGGVDANNTPLASHEVYAVKDNTWAAGPDLPEALAWCAAVSVVDPAAPQEHALIHIMGIKAKGVVHNQYGLSGVDALHGSNNRRYWVYSTRTQTYTPGPILTGWGEYMGDYDFALAVNDGVIYRLGGVGLQSSGVTRLGGSSSWSHMHATLDLETGAWDIDRYIGESIPPRQGPAMYYAQGNGFRELHYVGGRGGPDYNSALDALTARSDHYTFSLNGTVLDLFDVESTYTPKRLKTNLFARRGKVLTGQAGWGPSTTWTDPADAQAVAEGYAGWTMDPILATAETPRLANGKLYVVKVPSQVLIGTVSPTLVVWEIVQAALGVGGTYHFAMYDRKGRRIKREQRSAVNSNGYIGNALGAAPGVRYLNLGNTDYDVPQRSGDGYLLAFGLVGADNDGPTLRGASNVNNLLAAAPLLQPWAGGPSGGAWTEATNRGTLGRFFEMPMPATEDYLETYGNPLIPGLPAQLDLSALVRSTVRPFVGILNIASTY